MVVQCLMVEEEFKVGKCETQTVNQRAHLDMEELGLVWEGMLSLLYIEVF